MNEACRHLLGRQDFECFSKVHTDVNNFFCEIKEARWEESGNLVTFRICANRFLRNMVRAIVGTLLEIGREKIPPKSIIQIIDSKNRQQAGRSVPAHGLALAEVVYPDTIRDC